jgi:putative serine protease PepD
MSGPGSRHPRLRRLGGVTVVAVLAGGSGAGLATAWDDDPAVVRSAATSAPSAEARSVVLDGERLDVAGVVAAVGPAVVSIRTDVGGRLAGTGAGTGLVVSADGEVLTNAHVVEGASRINVTLAGESQSRRATLVGADAGADLALLRIDAADLDVAVLGSSASLAVGDDVVAIGNALALRGGPTVTRGIVSALDRSVDTGSRTMTGLVQTDASISSGNSGGPLVDAAGEVVGINTAVAAGGGGTAAENIGFAIAVDRVLPVLERLRDGTEADEAGYLGVDVEDPTDGSRGAVLTAVAPGGPADDAGLRPGDLVTALDGTPVDGAAALAGAVRSLPPGAVVEIDVARDGQERQVEATLSTAGSS